jgi:hypothetical protein
MFSVNPNDYVCVWCHASYHRYGNLEEHLVMKHGGRSNVRLEEAIPDVDPAEPEVRMPTPRPLAALHLEDSPFFGEADAMDLDDDVDAMDWQHDGMSRVDPRHPRPAFRFGSGFESPEPSQEPNSDAMDIDHEGTDSEAVRQVHIPSAGDALGPIPGYCEAADALWNNPWQPLSGPDEFLQADWFVRSHTPKGAVRDWFNWGLNIGTDDWKFKSGNRLYSLVGHMAHGLPAWHREVVSTEVDQRTFWYRDVLETARYLLAQPAYRHHLVYAPVQEFDKSGSRVYSEMNTADWWWETQMQLPRGSTVVPLIFSSDETHLTQFSGDQKAWPVYMTVGNIHSQLRMRPTSRVQMLVALLPVPPKFQHIRAVQDEQFRRIARQTLHSVIAKLLAPLLSFQIDGNHGQVWDCADGYRRVCWPFLASWIADHMEHANLQAVKYNACPKCSVPPNALGTPHQPQPLRDAERHHQCLAELDALPVGPSAERRELTNWFEQHHSRPVANVLWGYPNANPPNLHRPDLLHNLYLGMTKHLMGWLAGFLKHYNRLDRFDQVWSSVSRYPGLVHPRRAYRQVSQWQGRELRNLVKVIYPCLAAALDGCSGTERPIFHRALACVRALVNFTLMCQYLSYDEATLGYLARYLQEFHDTKSVFLPWRVHKSGKKAATRAQAAFTADRQEQRALEEEERQAAGQALTAAQRKREHTQDQAEGTQVYNVALEDTANFDFVKMHLLQHFDGSVRSFGYLQQYSTEPGELLHRSILKDPYRRSNRNYTADAQILDDSARSHIMDVRRMELLEQVRHRHYATFSLQRVLRLYNASDDRLVSHHNRKCIPIPQNLTVVLPEQRSAADRCRGRCLLVPQGSVSFAADERLPGYDFPLVHYLQKYLRDLNPQSHPHTHECGRFPVLLHKRLDVPVTRFQVYGSEESEVHHLRCTGDSPFRNGGPRNDDIFLAVEDPGNCDLHDVEPARLVRLLQFYDGIREHQVALVRRYVLTSASCCEPHTGLVRVQLPPLGVRHTVDLDVVNIKSIRQAAHLVQVPNTSDFFVNNTVDLKVFNTIYETSFDVGPEIEHVGLTASAVTESDDSDSDLPDDNDLLEDDQSSDDED